MPRISSFYGIAIYMYWNEADHSVTHVHAHRAGQRASISVDRGAIGWCSGATASWPG